MKKFAVIVAGGSGTRMMSDIPKQFLLLNEKPLLFYSIRAFLEAFEDCQIILVLPEEHVARGQEVIDAYFNYDRIKITIGGRARFHSVQQGLSLIEEEECVIFVHDAVRALLTRELIMRAYDSVIATGSAIPVISSKDSLRLITEAGNEATDRDKIKIVQTPQSFFGKIILPAYKIDYKDKYTDEAVVAEAFGLKLTLIDGEENNFKITSPLDLLIAEQLLTQRADVQ